VKYPRHQAIPLSILVAMSKFNDKVNNANLPPPTSSFQGIAEATKTLVISRRHLPLFFTSYFNNILRAQFRLIILPHFSRSHFTFSG